MLNNNSFHSRIDSGPAFALRFDPAFQSTFKRDRLCLAPPKVLRGYSGRHCRTSSSFNGTL